MFKKLRIAILLLILVNVGVGAWLARARTTSWERPPHVRMFVVFHDPKLTSTVPHSLGLQKGLIGVVHVFASDEQTAQNKVVVAHELLHTVGATDKYDPATNLPRFPDGYGDPQQQPLLPQRFAEIMAGRVAVSSTEAEMPADLGAVVVGAATAREINWVRRVD